MIRLGIVDDDAMVRTGLAFILGGEADLEVTWQTLSGSLPAWATALGPLFLEAAATLDADDADAVE